MSRPTHPLRLLWFLTLLCVPGLRAYSADVGRRSFNLPADDAENSLRLFAQKGAAGFYTGKTADAILQVMKEKGGTMTAADLTEYQPEWVDPISTTYRGWTVYELPPNTQGIAALMMLNLMGQYPLGEYGLGSARAMHAMIEAMRLTFADRAVWMGDEDFVHVPKSNFATTGPLKGLNSSPGFSIGMADDNLSEDGLDAATPDTTGVKSSIISLVFGSVPACPSGQAGFSA